jgi:hypothetical protein
MHPGAKRFKELFLEETVIKLCQRLKNEDL